MSLSPPKWARLLGTVVLSTGLLLTVDAPARADIPPADYQQVALATGAAELGEAMSLAVLPDRSVVHTSRDGTVRVTTAAGATSVAAKLNVYTHDEEGLQGVAADPGFATNRYVWLYFSPRLSTPDGDAPTDGTAADFAPFKGELHLSRFVLKTDNTLDLASEKVVMAVPNDRGQCCHVGGDIDFDAAGNLYLTTGDDTNPFSSDSYSPIDERTTRNPQFDAQRSAGNTNDLRGKLLRIHPQADGTYTIPSGNLFAPGTANTRPEIYGMGFRNPFRMSVDKATGVVYLGDYGPDAGVTDANRGPQGQVEFDRITGAGNFGWPYCTGSNTTTETYNHYTFPSGPSGAKYDCAGGPTNSSFRNTGLAKLPVPKAAWIKYAGDEGSPPEFGSGSESPMGGPVYRYDAASTSTVKFPQSLDGKFFAGEYGRKWIKAVTVNADGSRGTIDDFPWTGTQVMDMAFGPDGALYVLDYGTGSDNQALYRIEYLAGTNRNPVAKAAADKTSGANPLTVTFSSAGSSDPEGGALTYRWTFGDGQTSTAANPAHTYTTNGTYSPSLTVTDPAGLTGTASLVVTVGNTAPTVNLTTPADGQLFSFGDTVPFQVTGSDPEDGALDCSKVKVTYFLGHDSHQHQITQQTGCSGSIAVPVDGEHDAAANIFGVFDAQYTDNGGLVSHSVHKLQPRHRQGEHFSAQSGIQLADHGSAEGGRTVGYTDDGDWISFTPYALGNATSISARVSSGGPGGTLEVRAGSPTGTLLGSAAVANTGDWDTFQSVTANLTNRPSGSTTLYLVFKGVTGQGNLFDLDSFTFTTAAQPGAVEGESFTSGSGVQIAPHAAASGGNTLGYIENGDWAGYASVSTSGARTFTARVSSAGAGGTIEIRSGSATGTLLGTVSVPSTGDWEVFQNVTASVTGGSGPLFLVFRGGEGSLFDVDSFSLSTMPTQVDPAYNVLVFSKTAGFRHDSIPAGIQAIKELGTANGFGVTATEDASVFTASSLAAYQAVVFLSTTGDVLDATQQAAFESYVNGGGGYLGIHAAADTEYDWPWYGQLVGAWFKSHPAIQAANFVTEDRTNPATAHLPAVWNRTDELYNYRTNPRGQVHVLQTLDESSYTGGEMGADHPITWCHPQGSGRAFYTGLGHTIESYSDSAFRAELVGGIRYAAGVVAADCGSASSGSTVEGESFTSGSGVQIASHAPASGGQTLGYIENGDWAGYASVSTAGITRFSAVVSSAGAGGTIEIRADSATGTLLGTVAVPSTGGWETFQTVSTTVSSGSGPLHLVFRGGAGSLFDIDTLTVS
ncbi:carbohydrate-binding protein [Amycolatopsis sp. NPDC049252]|uniref:carbohydrate-binding protein n=1 Tax=Amycolatopsis sp. NPDC049252 TaxID=3363933 RepID=UPI00371B8500